MVGGPSGSELAFAISEFTDANSKWEQASHRGRDLRNLRQQVLFPFPISIFVT
jgi:hypothetical protein